MGNMKDFCQARSLVENWCKENKLKCKIQSNGNLIAYFNANDGQRYLLVLGTQDTDFDFADYEDYYAYNIMTADENDNSEDLIEAPSEPTLRQLFKLIACFFENTTQYKNFPTFDDTTILDEYIESYISAITNGRTTGYGYIEFLSDTWIDLLCEKASQVSDLNPRTADELKQWTLDVTHSAEYGRGVFDTYVKQVVRMYDSIKK